MSGVGGHRIPQVGYCIHQRGLAAVGSMIVLLLNADADAKPMDSLGRTALDMARGDDILKGTDAPEAARRSVQVSSPLSALTYTTRLPKR